MLQPNPIIGCVHGTQDSVELASGPGQILAVWTDGRTVAYDYVYGVYAYQRSVTFGRFLTEGTLLDPVGIRLGDGPEDASPDAAWNGSSYLVVWASAKYLASGLDIYACRVSSSGEILDGFNGFAIANGVSDEWKPRVASDGTDWFVVWQIGQGAESRIYGTKVLANGHVVTPGGARLCQVESPQARPSVTWTGAAYVVAFDDARNEFEGGDIYVTRILADGTVVDPEGIVVCSAAGIQGNAAVSASGSRRALVAWEDSRGGENDIYAARVTEGGLVLDPGGFSVCDEPGSQSLPDVTGDDFGNWVIAWEDNRATPCCAYAARVNSDGTVVDPDGVPVGPSPEQHQEDPSVVSDGTNAIVAYAASPAAARGASDLLGQRFDPAYPGPLPSFRLCQAAPYQRSTAITRTSQGFLAVFEENDTDPYDPDLYAACLDNNGMLTASGQVLLRGGSEWDVLPAVAFDGTNCLVAWVNKARDMGDIYAARVTQDGQLIDQTPLPICVASDAQIPVKVAYGGGAYLVVWEDGRADKPHIYGARVTPDGTVLDPDGFMICDCPEGHGARFPTVAWNGSSFLVAWTDLFGKKPPDVGSRIMGRFVPPEPQPVCPPPIEIQYAFYPSWVTKPSADWSGGCHLVVWEHTPGEGYQEQIRGKRISSTGEILDSTPIAISTESANRYPQTVWNGDHHLLAWVSYRAGEGSLYCARVLDSGEVLDKNGIPANGRPDCSFLDLVPGGDGKALLTFTSFAWEPPYGMSRIFEQWFTAPQVVRRISVARTLEEGSLITLVGKAVTAGTNDFADVFYVEEYDRSAGMRVLWNRSVVPRGLTATVSGIVKTVNGERVIEAQAVSTSEELSEPVMPLGMMNKSLGGSSPAPCVPGVKDSCGTYNVGLLVRTWGRVTAAGTDWFYIDDGSNLDDGSQIRGVKVTLAGLAEGGVVQPPEPGAYVGVTGLSSCEMREGNAAPIRLLRPRAASDIVDLSED